MAVQRLCLLCNTFSAKLEQFYRAICERIGAQLAVYGIKDYATRV